MPKYMPDRDELDCSVRELKKRIEELRERIKRQEAGGEPADLCVYEKIIPLFQEYYCCEPSDSLLEEMADIYQHLGEEDEAIECYRRLYLLHPKESLYMERLANAYLVSAWDALFEDRLIEAQDYAKEALKTIRDYKLDYPEYKGEENLICRIKEIIAYF